MSGYWSKRGGVYYNDGKAWTTDLEERVVGTEKILEVVPFCLGDEIKVKAILENGEIIPEDTHFKVRDLILLIKEDLGEGKPGESRKIRRSRKFSSARGSVGRRSARTVRVKKPRAKRVKRKQEVSLC